MKKLVFLILAITVIATNPLVADDPYHPLMTGLVAGISSFPQGNSPLGFAGASLGVQLHIIPIISLRPSVYISSTDENREDLLASQGSHPYHAETIFTWRLDALFHLIRFDSGSVYVGPGITFWSNSYKTTYYPSGPTMQEGNRSLWGVGMVIGGQYQFNPHFALYAETGVDYLSEVEQSISYNALGVQTSNIKYSTTYIEMRTPTLGVVVYLN